MELSVLFDSWDRLFSSLPGSLDLEKLAHETRAFLRCRGVPNAEALLRLILMVGPGGLSFQEAVSWASLTGLAQLTDASLSDRIQHSVGFMEGLVSAMLCAHPGSAGQRLPGRCLRISDGSSLSIPGSSGTDWRIHAVFDLEHGIFSHLEVTDKHQGESLARGAILPGEIRLADRGYAHLRDLRHLVEGGLPNAPVDFIVRQKINSFSYSSLDGTPFNLPDYLLSLPSTCQSTDLFLRINDPRGKIPPLETRLIIARKPESAVASERKRQKRRASRNQNTLKQDALLATNFILLVTSLDEEVASTEDVLEIYRLRWQIELAFKRMKTLLHIDKMRAHTENGAKVWILSHFLLALLIDQWTGEFLAFPPSAAA